MCQSITLWNNWFTYSVTYRNFYCNRTHHMYFLSFSYYYYYTSLDLMPDVSSRRYYYIYSYCR